MQDKEYTFGNKRYKLTDFKNEYEPGDRKNGLITCSYKVDVNGEIQIFTFKLPYSPDDEDAFLTAFEKEIQNQVTKLDSAN